jgi:uncharacterized protein
MPLPGLSFRTAPPPAGGLPSRADVALFVGLVGRRAVAAPAALRAELERAGWAGSGAFTRSAAAVEALLDVPVAVESWDAFDALFAWDARPVTAAGSKRTPCPLGAAVHAFFAEGGIRAWIVRCGDPLPVDVLPGDVALKRRLISWTAAAPPPDAGARAPLIPGFGGIGVPADPGDLATWRGAAHLFGIDDAAMLVLPDLPDLFAGVPDVIAEPAAPPPPMENFKPCAPPVPGAEPDRRARPPALTAPRLDRDGYRGWAAAIGALLRLMRAPRGSGHRRDVTLVAALPLPTHANVPARALAWPLAIVSERDLPAAGQSMLDEAQLGSAALQLAWPWIETPIARTMPEGVAGADGALAGVLARNALARGAFRSAAGLELTTVTRTLPSLARGDVERGLPDGRADWLGDRLCLVGGRPGGFVLMSDATMAADRARRAGGVARLIGIVMRAARWLGQDLLFEASGPLLWTRVRRELDEFLTGLWQLGALDGAAPAKAFTVRCDASTMSQADLDAGRVVATIELAPAQPVERITVTLALNDGGTGLEAREAA